MNLGFRHVATAVAEVVEEAIDKPVVPVEYEDYYLTLVTKVEGLRENIDAIREYVKATSQIPGAAKLAAVSRAKARMNRIEADERAGVEALAKIRAVLNAGCEPTTPPTTWWCGRLEATTSPGGSNETWPSRNITDRLSPSQQIIFNGTDITSFNTLPWIQGTGMVYHQPLPVEALTRYAALATYFDDVRVYSPNKEDFTKLQMIDPVLIGRILIGSEAHYFEIARWDVDKDLMAIAGE